MIQLRGPSVDEITGAARVMREKATRVTVPDGLTAIDLVGTGGDHAKTFNISTAASLVAAAAAKEHDVVVAKHGNKAVTSNSGSVSSQPSSCSGCLLPKPKCTNETQTAAENAAYAP